MFRQIYVEFISSKNMGSPLLLLGRRTFSGQEKEKDGRERAGKNSLKRHLSDVLFSGSSKEDEIRNARLILLQLFKNLNPLSRIGPNLNFHTLSDNNNNNRLVGKKPSEQQLIATKSTITLPNLLVPTTPTNQPQL